MKIFDWLKRKPKQESDEDKEIEKTLADTARRLDEILEYAKRPEMEKLLGDKMDFFINIVLARTGKLPYDTEVGGWMLTSLCIGFITGYETHRDKVFTL